MMSALTLLALLILSGCWLCISMSVEDFIKSRGCKRLSKPCSIAVKYGGATALVRFTQQKDYPDPSIIRWHLSIGSVLAQRHAASIVAISEERRTDASGKITQIVPTVGTILWSEHNKGVIIRPRPTNQIKYFACFWWHIFEILGIREVTTTDQAYIVTPSASLAVIRAFGGKQSAYVKEKHISGQTYQTFVPNNPTGRKTDVELIDEIRGGTLEALLQDLKKDSQEQIAQQVEQIMKDIGAKKLKYTTVGELMTHLWYGSYPIPEDKEKWSNKYQSKWRFVYNKVLEASPKYRWLFGLLQKRYEDMKMQRPPQDGGGWNAMCRGEQLRFDGFRLPWQGPKTHTVQSSVPAHADMTKLMIAAVGVLLMVCIAYGIGVCLGLTVSAKAFRMHYK